MYCHNYFVMSIYYEVKVLSVSNYKCMCSYHVFLYLTNIQLYVGIFDHVGVVRIYINSVLYGI